MKACCRRTALLFLAVLFLFAAGPSARTEDGMSMYAYSTFIEKEQPELTEETKALIAAWRRSPTQENYLALRAEVVKNYNAVLAKKEEKLAELKETVAGKPGGAAIIAEMEEIVQEMYVSYWSRINSSMLRFTDPRLLRWRVADAAQYDYVPVMGAGESVYIKRTPVTNAEYALFLAETGHAAPASWADGAYPEGEDEFPVNEVSCADALAYCAWLTEKDGENAYRLPSESEWELAAGHMPKDADFNCGVADGRVSVEAYAAVTRGAHGAVDFWGNVWEWTATARGELLAVKGGSWRSPRTDCRTEYRQEGRDPARGYDDVGFRPIRLAGGREPEQAAALCTLEAPAAAAARLADGSVLLSWEAVEGAVEYQAFACDGQTGLLRMLERTETLSLTVSGLSPEEGCIVQALSYTDVSDNVSPKYSVKPQ